MKKQIKNVLMREAETKRTIANFSDNTQLAHMELKVLDPFPFFTSKGLDNPTAAGNGVSVAGNRVGDMIQPKSLKFKLFLENNERFSQVVYKFWFVSCAKGATINVSTFFQGRSDNKMIDEVETASLSGIKVLWSKEYTIKAPNPGVNMNIAVPVTYTLAGSGTFAANSSVPIEAYTPGAKVVQFSLPVPKKVVFKDGNPIGKDYYLLLMPYVVIATSTLVAVCKINDMTKTFSFKDI